MAYAQAHKGAKGLTGQQSRLALTLGKLGKKKGLAMPKKWCPECAWQPHNRRTTKGRPTAAGITKPANTKMALAMHRRHKHSEPPRPLLENVPPPPPVAESQTLHLPGLGVLVRFTNGEQTIIQGDLFAKSAALVQVWQRGNEVARYPAQMVEHVELLAKATA